MPPLSLAVDTSILDAVIVAAGYGWGQMSPCVTGAVDVFRGQLWLCDMPLTLVEPKHLLYFLKRDLSHS